jgi:hypothetical protein
MTFRDSQRVSLRKCHRYWPENQGNNSSKRQTEGIKEGKEEGNSEGNND